MFPAGAASFLACPHCAAGLRVEGASLRCASGHAFDVARQGYVNLAPGAVGRDVDTAEMVQARERFLARGHYGSLSAELAEVAASWAGAGGVEGCVVECGAGTGYYLAKVMDALPGRVGLAIDLSKYAARRAARIHPQVASIVADVEKQIPVKTGAVALALSVFAPRNAVELARVMTPGGLCVVAIPGAAHLQELIEPLGLIRVDPRKEERLHARLGGAFEWVRESTLEQEIALTRADVIDLAQMGPSAFHVGHREMVERAGALREPVNITTSFKVLSFRRKPA